MNAFAAGAIPDGQRQRAGRRARRCMPSTSTRSTCRSYPGHPRRIRAVSRRRPGTSAARLDRSGLRRRRSARGRRELERRGGVLRVVRDARQRRAASHRGRVGACRARTARGRGVPVGDEMPAWIPEGGRGPLAGPWPVTLGEPNAFGLSGIAANVHEWCADWHDRGYYSRRRRRGIRGDPRRRQRRASRGGSWRHAVTISRCAARSKIDPSFRYTDYGFRTVGDACERFATGKRNSCDRREVRDAGGRALVVGGWVRDRLHGTPVARTSTSRCTASTPSG